MEFLIRIISIITNMKIKNFKDLASSSLRRDTLSIVESGLQAIDTSASVRDQVRIEGDTLWVKGNKFSLKEAERVFVVGAGKSSLEAAEALEEKMKDRIEGGVVIDTKEESKLEKIRYFQGDHPYPTEKNVEATSELIKFLKGLEKTDLVISLISGGGSALLCQPTDFDHVDEKNILQFLFKAGATIQEINTIRKHLSKARGGGLAYHAHPASVISLIFSDVPGDELEFVASGPTIKDSTTVEEAKEVLIRYNLWQKHPISINSFIETPKKDYLFNNVSNILFISNKTALQKMSDKANELGFSARIADTQMTGEAREVGELIAETLKDEPSQTALFYGGETTVTITGDGAGGRNQELALSALRFVERGFTVAAVASDGVDNTDHAGAIVDIHTKEKAEKLGLKVEGFLQNNDSYNFFEKTGDYIYTGPTGSNVADLIIGLKL